MRGCVTTPVNLEEIAAGATLFPIQPPPPPPPPSPSLPSELTYTYLLPFTPAEEKCLTDSKTIQLCRKSVNFIAIILIDHQIAKKQKSLPWTYQRHLKLLLQQPEVFTVLKGSWLLLNYWCFCPIPPETVKRSWGSETLNYDAELDLTGCSSFQKRNRV